MRIHHFQPEVLHERHEVWVCVKQGQPVFNATGSNKRVNGFPDRDPINRIDELLPWVVAGQINRQIAE